MALLVHLTPQRHIRRILRAGIKATSPGPEGTRCVYCLPILPSYVISHQWLRELKRRGQGTILAVDFASPTPPWCSSATTTVQPGGSRPPRPSR